MSRPQSFRLLITGSRTWEDKDRMYAALETIYYKVQQRNAVLVHGEAKGADLMAASIWHKLGGITEGHPADWNSHSPDCPPFHTEGTTCRRAGYIRNQLMVDLGAHLCLAFIRDGSKGATMCANLAEKAGIKVVRFIA